MPTVRVAVVMVVAVRAARAARAILVHEEQRLRDRRERRAYVVGVGVSHHRAQESPLGHRAVPLPRGLQLAQPDRLDHHKHRRELVHVQLRRGVRRRRAQRAARCVVLGENAVVHLAGGRHLLKWRARDAERAALVSRDRGKLDLWLHAPLHAHRPLRRSQGERDATPFGRPPCRPLRRGWAERRLHDLQLQPLMDGRAIYLRGFRLLCLDLGR
eukprot:scaffold47544_cov59-Phaeocystis_antarctica.AAC.4